MMYIFLGDADVACRRSLTAVRQHARSRGSMMDSELCWKKPWPQSLRGLAGSTERAANGSSTGLSQSHII